MLVAFLGVSWVFLELDDFLEHLTFIQIFVYRHFKAEGVGGKRLLLSNRNIEHTLIGSVVDPKLFIPDPDPALNFPSS